MTLKAGGSVLPACSSLFPLLPSPTLLCWAISRRLGGMLGRVQAGRLLGDRRRLSGWGGAGRLQAAGVGAGVFFASASLPLSVSLRASSGRPPLGGRGLKFASEVQNRVKRESPSPRRAWIEILPIEPKIHRLKSPSPRRAWIEIPMRHTAGCSMPSPSPRRAWIEILLDCFTDKPAAKSPSPRRAWIEIRSNHARRA